MLTIRFLRTGKKNQPHFKIVVTEKQNSPIAGRFLEEVGSYNPLTKERTMRRERIQHWISKGAQPSPRVHNLLIAEGVITGKKIPLHNKVAPSAAESPSEQAPEEQRAEQPAKEPAKQE